MDVFNNVYTGNFDCILEVISTWSDFAVYTDKLRGLRKNLIERWRQAYDVNPVAKTKTTEGTTTVQTTTSPQQASDDVVVRERCAIDDATRKRTVAPTQSRGRIVLVSRQPFERSHTYKLSNQRYPFSYKKESSYLFYLFYLSLQTECLFVGLGKKYKMVTLYPILPSQNHASFRNILQLDVL